MVTPHSDLSHKGREDNTKGASKRGEGGKQNPSLISPVSSTGQALYEREPFDRLRVSGMEKGVSERVLETWAFS